MRGDSQRVNDPGRGSGSDAECRWSVPMPTRAELSGMRDVVAALKEYRAQTRRAYELLKAEAEGKGERGKVRLGAPHYHWTGRLEVSVVGG
jgi:hypothetical protein